MKVILLSHTENADDLAEICAKGCYSQDGASKIEPTDMKRVLHHAVESGHESVLEHASYTFSIEGVSRACSHQLIRHRIASYSQQSQRYARVDKESYITPNTIYNVSRYEEVMNSCNDLYNDLISEGVPEEDARYVLPNAMCTNLVVTMNARSLRNFFKLRLCKRAQWEIREVAKSMLEICKKASPVIFEGVGASCDMLGYCPEKNTCGRMDGLIDVIKGE